MGRFAYLLHVCHPICSFYQKTQNNQVHRRARAAHPPGHLHQAAVEDLCQPSTTLDIYTHAFDKNKKAANAGLQEMLEI